MFLLKVILLFQVYLSSSSLIDTTRSCSIYQKLSKFSRNYETYVSISDFAMVFTVNKKKKQKRQQRSHRQTLF